MAGGSRPRRRRRAGAAEPLSPSPIDRDAVAEICEELRAYRVEFVLVGGSSTQLHGATRPTMDVDAVVGWNTTNLDRLAAALRAMEAKFRIEGEPVEIPGGLHRRHFENGDFTTLTTSFGDVDILRGLQLGAGPELTGYESLRERSTVVHVHGVQIDVASLEDVIAAKERAGRGKDRAALPELYALRDGTPYEAPSELAPADPPPTATAAEVSSTAALEALRQRAAAERKHSEGRDGRSSRS